MATKYVAYANGTANQLGPADAGISIYRKDVSDGQVWDEQEIYTWTGTEIDDEDGTLNEDAAEQQLLRLGWRIADAGWRSSADGQSVVEVEADPSLGPVAGQADGPFAEGDEVTSSLFDGKALVVKIEETEALTRVIVRVSPDSGVVTIAGTAAYAPEDLRRA